MYPGHIQIIHKKGWSGEKKVLMKLKPANQAVGMIKKMRGKIKYEK